MQSLLFCLLCNSPLLQANIYDSLNVVCVDMINDSLSINGYVELYEDTTRVITFQEIKELSFVPLRKKNVTNAGSITWYKFTIFNANPKLDFHFIHPFGGNPNIEKTAEIFTINHSKKDTIYSIDGLHADIKGISYRNICCGLLFVPALDTVTFYIKIDYKDVNSIYTPFLKSQQLEISGKLYSKKYAPSAITNFIIKDYWVEIFGIFFFSFCIVLFLSNSLQYILNKEKANLFYALYILSLFLYYILSLEIRHQERFFFLKYFGAYLYTVRGIFYNLVFLTQFLFYRYFTKSFDNHKQLDKSITWGIRLILMITICLAAFDIFNINYNIHKTLLSLIILPYTIFLIISLFRLNKKLYNILGAGSTILFVFFNIGCIRTTDAK